MVTGDPNEIILTPKAILIVYISTFQDGLKRWISFWLDFPPPHGKKQHNHHPPTWFTKDDLNSTFASASLVLSTPVLSGKHLGSTRNLLLQFTHEVGIRGEKFAGSSLHFWRPGKYVRLPVCFFWGKNHEQRKITLYIQSRYMWIIIRDPLWTTQ